MGLSLRPRAEPTTVAAEAIDADAPGAAAIGPVRPRRSPSR